MMSADHARRGDASDMLGLREEVAMLDDDDSSDDDQPKRTNGRDIVLTPEQEAIIRAAEDGRNVFITGAAGVGKSFLLSHIVEALTKQGNRVAVTASTGIAAVQVNGITLHAFAGVGLADSPAEELAKAAKKNQRTRKRWQEHSVLVIDEISMISKELLDKVNAVAKACRNNSSAMGGMQVILCGDFYQLPPVNKKDDLFFAFESETWPELQLVCLNLTTIFRQRDSKFIGLLCAVREGQLSREHYAILEKCRRPLETREGEVLPTQLLPLRASVEKINKARFDELSGEEIQEYNAFDFGNERLRQKFDKDVPAPSKVVLKVNTQIILVSNIDLSVGLCNGSRGIVVGFEECSRPPVKGCPNGFKPKEISNQINSSKKLPVVKFANGVTVTIYYQCWDRGRNAETVGRVQIPLIHAWALTVHKSQGMSIDRLRTSLDKVFEGGMAYVALSRARNLEGLQIDAFDATRIYAHSRVKEFYQGLSSTVDELAHSGYLVQSSSTRVDSKCKMEPSPVSNRPKPISSGGITEDSEATYKTENPKRRIDGWAAEGESKRIRSTSQTGPLLQARQSKAPRSHGRKSHFSSLRHDLAMEYSILFRDEILHSDADREMAFKLRDEYISAIESSMNERLMACGFRVDGFSKKLYEQEES